MSGSPANNTYLWLGGISAVIIVALAGVLFGQMRFIAQQNHQLMIENQRIEIQLDQLKTRFDMHGAQVVAKLDSGLPLVSAADYRTLNIQDELKGPIMGALIRQLKDDRFFVKLNGLTGLAAMAPDLGRREIFAPMVVPAVIPTLKDERLRVWGMSVLNQYQRHAAAAAPMVLETCDATRWIRVTSSIKDARIMDPQCDYMPLLIRHIEQSEDDWKITLVRLQHGFTDEEVLQAYEGALEQASNEKLKRRYSGIVRYLKNQPPTGSAPPPPRSVESYIEED
ncbi:hypothetical protein Pan97_02090 [Bremerella volcania]|uniref:HEAT repeat protein n=1 Tax=Bremerella volcania TaxID=2527984 RepID=A0A518C1Z7_9BACT|nr:hypothetical protein [Bremerella volcania]QDU73242.1 hypothetical protein Pan97_02090 [Bremerella volcania]